MLSISEIAHQKYPETIADVIRHELQRLEIEQPDVEASIIDSSLELQIRTDSAIDKEKLLTLVRGEIQNLHIESVAKFRIHCWRNDQELHEYRLLWSEQLMLESLKSPLSQTLELDNSALPETRAAEPQLSKASVLQQAIAKISSTSQQESSHLIAAKLAEQSPIIEDHQSISLNSQVVHKPQASVDNNYWQLLLVGLSIVLLGLGIGAAVRAITIKNAIDSSSSANLNVEDTSVSNKSKSKTANIPNPSTTASVTDTKNSTKPNQNFLSETITPSPNNSEAQTSVSPKVSEDETVITLEKFNRIQKGMTVEQVEKIFGISGKVIAENNSADSVGKVYSWKNSQGSNAIVEFKDGQVVAKAQAGL